MPIIQSIRVQTDRVQTKNTIMKRGFCGLFLWLAVMWAVELPAQTPIRSGQTESVEIRVPKGRVRTRKSPGNDWQFFGIFYVPITPFPVSSVALSMSYLGFKGPQRVYVDSIAFYPKGEWMARDSLIPELQLRLYILDDTVSRLAMGVAPSWQGEAGLVSKKLPKRMAIRVGHEVLLDSAQRLYATLTSRNLKKSPYVQARRSQDSYYADFDKPGYWTFDEHKPQCPLFKVYYHPLPKP